MLNYNIEDFKRTIQKINDILHPVYLFCNPIHFEDFRRELDETIFEVISNTVVEENKIYLINKADLMYPFGEPDIPKIDLSKLKEIIDKGGDD